MAKGAASHEKGVKKSKVLLAKRKSAVILKSDLFNT